jgi:tetratricopeptide (TPR) repeat protein
MLGYCNFLQGNLFSAENALKTALTLDNTNKDVYQLLAQVLLQESRYKEARAMFQEMIKANPNKEQWWMALVNTYLAENDLDNCVVSLEVLRHMKKAETQSLYLLGNIYLTRNMFDMATDVYCQAIAEGTLKSNKSPETVKGDIDSALDSARALAGYSAFDQATRILNMIDTSYKVSKTDEQQMDILTIRSNVNIAQGKGEEAAKDLKQILERDPLNGDALNTLASFYCELIDVDIDGKTVRQPRDLQMAIMMLERAEDVNDNRIKLRAFTQHARLMVTSQDTDSLRKAVVLLKRAQEIEPTDGVEQYIQEIQKAIDARSSR